MSKPYRCPFCKSILKPGEPRRYEILVEHVCDPNGDQEIRETWECNCVTSEHCWWGYDGGLYTDSKMSQGHSSLIRRFKNTEAMYSICWRVQEEMLKRYPR